MDYRIVNLPAKTMVGLTGRTANNDPQMGEIIGGLWQQLFAGGVYEQIPHKAGANTIGLYSDYADGVNGVYSITVGCEVTETDELPTGTVRKGIPGGRYAKVTVIGDQVEAVGRAWGELWQMPLERTYTGDFEEYNMLPDGSQQIDIYVAIR